MLDILISIGVLLIAAMSTVAAIIVATLISFAIFSAGEFIAKATVQMMQEMLAIILMAAMPRSPLWQRSAFLSEFVGGAEAKIRALSGPLPRTIQWQLFSYCNTRGWYLKRAN